MSRATPADALEIIAQLDERIASLQATIAMLEDEGFEPWTCEQLRAAVRHMEHAREELRESAISVIDARP